jgi:hypothetical protein
MKMIASVARTGAKTRSSMIFKTAQQSAVITVTVSPTGVRP